MEAIHDYEQQPLDFLKKKENTKLLPCLCRPAQVSFHLQLNAPLTHSQSAGLSNGIVSRSLYSEGPGDLTDFLCVPFPISKLAELKRSYQLCITLNGTQGR